MIKSHWTTQPFQEAVAVVVVSVGILGASADDSGPSCHSRVVGWQHLADSSIACLDSRKVLGKIGVLSLVLLRLLQLEEVGVGHLILVVSHHGGGRTVVRPVAGVSRDKPASAQAPGRADRRRMDSVSVGRWHRRQRHGELGVVVADLQGGGRVVAVVMVDDEWPLDLGLALAPTPTR